MSKQNTVQDIHTMKDYSAIKRNEALLHATTQMNLENMLSERSQSRRPLIVSPPLYEKTRLGRSQNQKDWGCTGAGSEERELRDCRWIRFLREWWKIFQNRLCDGWTALGCHQKPKTQNYCHTKIQSYTLNEWIVWDMNYLKKVIITRRRRGRGGRGEKKGTMGSPPWDLLSFK